jgi:1,4-alpha-glucan branching enzyme
MSSDRASRATTVAAPAAASAPLRSAASSESDSRPIPQQFVFDNVRAHRVSVVGDFNTWNPTSAAMTRSSDGRLWSVIIPIYPGRHIYGFMVDDSVFTLDPRAPKVRDADLGTEGSVVIVGRP